MEILLRVQGLWGYGSPDTCTISESLEAVYESEAHKKDWALAF